MTRKTVFLRQEQGQSIVLIAMVMLGLLALAGLAIDGGNLFLQRRNTQNAADSGALAGTRVLAEAVCGESDATDAAVAAAVAEYVQLNGVEDMDGVTAYYNDFEETVLGEVGAGSIPVGASGVSVDVVNNVATFFLTIVGIDDVDVSAEALALTGPPSSAGGVRPVGVPLEMVVDLGPGDNLWLSFGNCNANPEQCIAGYTGGQIQHRGWLNLMYVWHPSEATEWPRALDPSADANVLKEWMDNGGQVVLNSGDYIHAKPGRNSSVIGQAPIGEIIMVPIFDEVPNYDDIPDPKPEAANQGGDFYYHIVGFLAFRVTGAHQGSGELEGEVVQVILGNGQVGGGGGTGYGQGQACQSHTQAVNLWR